MPDQTLHHRTGSHREMEVLPVDHCADVQHHWVPCAPVAVKTVRRRPGFVFYQTITLERLCVTCTAAQRTVDMAGGEGRRGVEQGVRAKNKFWPRSEDPEIAGSLQGLAPLVLSPFV